MVTVTAGGNDVYFSALLTSCLGFAATANGPVTYVGAKGSPTACAAVLERSAQLLGGSYDAATGALVAPTNVTRAPLRSYSTLERRLGSLYRYVLTSSGAATHVVVVTYPTLISGPTSGPCLVSAQPLSLANSPAQFVAFPPLAARSLADLEVILNREILAVVNTLHVRARRLLAVSVTNFSPLNCASGLSSDLNGVSAASLSSGGAFHPTALGQGVLARSVMAQLRRAKVR